METVSVVVPVYNSKQYLKRCLESLLHQTYDYLEIILVDDGSTDGSFDICDELAKKSKKIKVIHQNNRGVTAARNHGIKECTGDYITFVDSDDWIDVDFIENAVDAFKRNQFADICVQRMQFDYLDGSSSPIGIVGLDNLFTQREAIEEMFRWTFFRWELCGKVYRSQLFTDFQADENIPICEDLDSNWTLFHKASYVFYTGKSIYHYFANDTSATHTGNYIYDTTLNVYDKILKSNYEVPYAVKMKLMHESISIIAKKLREMYFQNPTEYDEKIDALLERLRALILLFPNEPVIKSGLLEVLLMKKEEQKKIFEEEFSKIKSAVKKVEQYKQIIIYGTGVLAEYIYRLLGEKDQEKVIFSVSDGAFSRNLFCSRPVRKISEIENDADMAIFMSLQDKVRPAVVEDLKSRGFKHIIEFSMRNIYIKL